MSVSYQLACDQGATLAFSTVWRQSIPAATWAAGTIYGINDVVSPSESNGFLYTPLVAGLSDDIEPTWPQVVGSTAQDGSVLWSCEGPQVSPVDLTNYTAYMSVATATGATTWLATVSTTPSSAGQITLGGVTGTITVNITGETTITFTTTPLFYDLFVISPTDVSTMLLTGKIKINSNVTIPTYE
jgi:hypothetical protein